jgi:hypothetical protein
VSVNPRAHVKASFLLSVVGRAVNDADAPEVAKAFYQELMKEPVVDFDNIAYALDTAVARLRATGLDSHRWAPFAHFGA